MTNSVNVSGKLSRSVLSVNLPFVEIDAHFRRMLTQMNLPHLHTDTALPTAKLLPFKSALGVTHTAFQP